MSKLWMIFQTQYRISAAYQAAVVLIESTRPARSALPVLKRGSEDRGPGVTPSASPVIDEVLPPNSQQAARLGEDLIINGKHLDRLGLTVRFDSLRLGSPIEIEPLPGGTEEQMKAHLSDLPEDADAFAKWMTGFYTVSLVIRNPGLPSWTSNEVSFALAPRITVTPNTAPEGNLVLTVTCTPRIREGQRIILLFGESQIQIETIDTPIDVSMPTTLTFSIPDAKKGEYVVRLRVDGADSIPVVLAGTPPGLEFDPSQKVAII
jgi:hypothetical protein